MTPSPAGNRGAEALTQPVSDLRQREEASVIGVGDDGTPQLVGSRCTACGTLAVPERFVCMACASRDLDRELAGRAGTLYSYATVQVSSSRETPYTLGYVDLDSGARVLATITGDPDRWAPDIRVELSVDGEDDWSFAPVSQEQPS